MGSHIDEVITMERGGNTYFYHYDGLGSARFITDGSGNIVEKYDYDPYGNPTILDSNNQTLTTSAIDNPYMFTGRRWDEESSIYYYRARMYNPEIGRFLQRDPLGYFDSMNLYSYTVNDPVNFVDPYGLQGVPNIPGILGGLPPGAPIPWWLTEMLDQLGLGGADIHNPLDDSGICLLSGGDNPLSPLDPQRIQDLLDILEQFKKRKPDDGGNDDGDGADDNDAIKERYKTFEDAVGIWWGEKLKNK